MHIYSEREGVGVLETLIHAVFLTNADRRARRGVWQLDGKSDVRKTPTLLGFYDDACHSLSFLLVVTSQL